MWKLNRSLGLLTCVVAAFSLSCSSEPESSEPELPRQVDSGFVFLQDAFVFENYGGAERGPQLTEGLVARMFGAENVCMGNQLPCELNPIAEGWMTSINGTLNEGRSEGFAITSLLFHAGLLDPNDFGGESVADLRLFANPQLQKEIAYWAATQSVPSALTNDVRYQAEDVLPFLAEVLQADTEKHYRLAIAQRTDRGFARGHAVTPIGFYKGEGDVYWLRIYDNNFPAQERRIEINPVANTWRYEVPPIDDDGEMIVYEGTPENGNYLYFSAIEDRMGELKAPFASDSGVRTINYSSITLVASRGEGDEAMETGIRDGEILEAGEDRVVPAFSACPRCGGDVPIVNQSLIDAGIARGEVISIEAEGEVRTAAGQGDAPRFGLGGNTSNVGEKPGDGNVDWIKATGPDYTTTVYTEGNLSEDAVSFAENGSTSYTAGSGNGVKINTSTTTDDNQYVTYIVSVQGSGDEDIDVTVNITTGENGETIIEIENLPEGKQVTVDVGRINGNDTDDRSSESVTFTSNGGTSTTVLDPVENKIAVENANDVAGGNCTNGLLDEDFETDVDCGGECNGCGDGKLCEVDDDCEGGVCVAEGEILVCQAVQCYDGVQNGDETDVDCGGDLCGACTATVDQRTTPQCSVETDCDTGICIDGRCRIKQPVVVKANRLPQDGTDFRYILDGTHSSRRLQSDNLEGPHEFVIGDAYTYQTTWAGDCSTDFTEETTGITSDDDQEPRGVIELDCPEEGVYTFFADLEIRTFLPPVPDDDPVTVQVTADGETSEFTMSGAGGRLAVTTFTESWSIEVIKNPLNPIVNSATPPEMGSFDCYALPWRSNSGSGANLSRTGTVFCNWVETATCSDGIKNQDESDVDCGGVCDACGATGQCFSDTDCEGDIPCVSGVCVDGGSCNDGIQNQDETDVDCGGSNCGPCEAQEACLVSSDCLSTICQGDVCVEATCSDGIKNQDESDVDCGGVCPTKCAIGATCNIGSDCDQSGCDNGICAETCSDGFQNQGETDVDCGGNGTGCDRCADGLVCASFTDCASQYCLNDICATPTCDDGIQNQGETGVDCGGLNCTETCDDGESCFLDSDCTSNDCVNNICAASTCDDGIQNQDETGVDCGGPNCTETCDDGQACFVDGDCTSNYCVNDICTAATCSDGVQNQDETDVDCGGTSCDSCVAGQSCNVDGDCANNLCTNNICEESCSDGIQNQDETGVDCGGSICGPCGAGSACTLDSDCSTDNCECSASSGNCAGNSGLCGAAKLVVDLPTTDGTTVSGSFTVPAQCDEVYVQAWGAAGGAGGDGGGFPGPGGGGLRGGASGYVSGTLSVSDGDVIDVWIGQGGDYDIPDFDGEPGIGSKYGVATYGGLGDETAGGGGGGGLTSVEVTGSTPTSFVIPAGGGGNEFSQGDDVVFGAGGGAVDSNGEDAEIFSGNAGGGAGEIGGSAVGINGGGGAGTYSAYPAGFSTADGLDGVPANTSAPDYSLCEGIGGGEVGAGSNEIGSMWDAGGDGCVILRCVAP